MKKVNYAVLVIEENEVKFVTETKGSYAEWADGQAAKLMSKSVADDLAFGLCVNGYPAMVVIVPSYLKNLGNR